MAGLEELFDRNRAWAAEMVERDPAFFTTMRTWASQHRYSHGSVQQYIALAEEVSGQDLGAFFDTWLFTPTKPAATQANGFPAAAGSGSAGLRAAAPASRRSGPGR